MQHGKITHKHDTSQKTEIAHYLVLFCGLMFFAVMAYFYRLDPSVQFLMFFAATAFYTLWGVIHHYLENRLTWAVVAEYLFFAFIVFFLVVLSLGTFWH